MMSFLRDALGSTVALTDNTGALNIQYTYQPFGATTASGPANANPYQFTGRENDATGLHYYRARYYSATLQRFISQDPIGFEGGPNVYALVNNNPVDATDPSGLMTCRRLLMMLGAWAGGELGPEWESIPDWPGVPDYVPREALPPPGEWFNNNLGGEGGHDLGSWL